MKKLQEIKGIIILAWVLGFLWAYLILSLSGEPASVSKQKSMAITQKVEVVVEYIEAHTGIAIIDRDNLHHCVRKAAHMLAYFVLALLLLIALTATGVKGKWAYLATWAIAFPFSMLDEYYQSFIPGRGPQVTDVLLDNLGVLSALLLVFFGQKLLKACQTRNLNKPE